MEKRLNVRLLSYTPNPEKLVAAAAKLCYSNSSIDDLLKKQTPERAREFIGKLMEMGHESPIEHIVYNFGIEGISRACSHQLVRHRHASYSQQSQRYVDEQSDRSKDRCFDFIVPETIEKIGLENEFMQDMSTIQRMYDKWHKKLEEAGLRGEEVHQDARYVLPNAAETKIMVTMNARSLLNFFKLRMCNRAQWEIRNLAFEMYKLVFPTAPTLFAYVGPSCVSKDRCEEGKFSCGKKKEVRKKFDELKKLH